MRTEAEVREVFRLHALGLSQAEIARRVGVARATVRGWIASDPGALARRRQAQPCAGSCHAAMNEPAYAYLLGEYLGDGCISPMKKSFRLRITCCDAYPAIMDETAEAIRSVVPGGTVGRVPRIGCTEVANYWRHWPCVLPHGEGGVKHERLIMLEPWQSAIALHREPQRFLRGLIHSDGWRGINRVRGANGSRYEYPRYQFSNRSVDIRRLFCEACDRVGVEWRQMNRWNISVAKRSSVELLDQFIGPKA
jgi:hypothetical protein